MKSEVVLNLTIPSEICSECGMPAVMLTEEGVCWRCEDNAFFRHFAGGSTWTTSNSILYSEDQTPPLTLKISD